MPSRGRPAALHGPFGETSCGRSWPRCGREGWALADEELAPGVRSVAVPVRDGTGSPRRHERHRPRGGDDTDTAAGQSPPALLSAAGDVSNEWALWLSRPHTDVGPIGPTGAVQRS